MSVVYTGGTFDLLHVGHLGLLKQCSALAGPDGRVVVALNTDEFIRQYKGRPPIIGFDQRALVLEACRYVDEVVPNIGGADSRPTIKWVKPDIIAVGADWESKDYLGQLGVTQEFLDDRQITVEYVHHDWSTAISDTIIVNQILQERG